MKLTPARLELREANDFVALHHRHHKPVTGHRFSLGVDLGGRIVGCVIVGRPVARKTDQKHIAEVTRLVTDGTPNACSFLYSHAARVAQLMGFKSIQTFILQSESGVSLRASGWRFKGATNGGSWHSRKGRRSDQPECIKHKYERILNQK